MPARWNRGTGRYGHARGSGLTDDDAERGMRRFFGTPHGNRIDAVLIVGDNFSIDWKRGDG